MPCIWTAYGFGRSAVFTAVLQLQLEGLLVSSGNGVSQFTFAYPLTDLLAWRKGCSLFLHQRRARKFVRTLKCLSFEVIVNIPNLSVFCLGPGAGQDVGRSCILVSIAGKNVMLDCGMHMGYNDDVSTVEKPQCCVEMPSRCICLAFPSRAPGSSFRSVPFYLNVAWLVLHDVWVIWAGCALLGTGISYCWSWITAENELLLPLQNLAFLCKRCVSSSIPAIWSATVQPSFSLGCGLKKKY